MHHLKKELIASPSRNMFPLFNDSFINFITIVAIKTPSEQKFLSQLLKLSPKFQSDHADDA